MGGRTRRVVILTAVSVALLAPSIVSDLFNDDYFLGSPLIERQTLWNAYEFVSPENPALVPWWSAEGFQIRFFRPLASATLRFDFGLLGGSPLLAHLHSLLWFVVFLLGGFALLGRVLEGRSLTLSMVVLALSSFPTWAVGWIAARHAVMGGALVVWAAIFYLRWRGGGPRWTAAAAVAGFVLALLSSESGLAFVGFALSYELVMARGPARERLLAALPTVLLAILYLVAYKLLGYGAAESGAYVDPIGEPLEYLTLAAPKVLALLGTFALGVPAMMRMIPAVAMIPTAAGVMALALLLLGLRLGWRHQAEGEARRLGWLTVMALLAMAPALSGLVEGRGVLLSGVGFSAIAGVILSSLLARRGVLAWLVILPLCFGMMGLSPLMRLGMSAFILMGSRTLTAMGQGEPLSCQRGARFYVVNSDPFTSVGAPYIIAHHQGRTFESWHQLVLAGGELTLTRTGPDRIRLTRAEGLFDAGLRLAREDYASLTPGTRVQRPHLTAEVVTSNPTGPATIDFTIEDLGDPSEVCLTTIDGGRLEPVALPEVGGSTQVTFSPPQMGER